MSIPRPPHRRSVIKRSSPGSRRGVVEHRLGFGPLQGIWYPRATAVVVVLALFCCLMGVQLATHGTYHMTPAQVLHAVLHPDDSPAASIVWNLRLPRVATGLVTGACLGVSGLLFQSLTRNELGSPEIMGLVSGAALGAVVGVTIFRTSGWATAMAAVLGCTVAVTVSQMIVMGTGAATTRLLLVGIGLSALWSSLSSLLLTRTDPDVAIGAQIWLTGSLNARTWTHAMVPAAALLIALPLAVLRSRHLALLDSGEDMSTQLGLSRTHLTRLTGLLGVLLTGAAIASTGPISFVALAAPHIARRLAGRPAVPVITAALTGATVLLGAETLARMLPEQQSVPVGIATSVLGGLYLLVTIARRPE